ncbi:hypothetical protein ACX3VT_02170 [Aerococcus sanguinicola]|nr:MULTISPECIES: hypothetical protein [unclassified Aerococcus]KAB0646661.1 hypothetical protein F6I01_06440 [Aerococcus sanguinicola]OHO46365.1 hypothetical protein HMPREF2705_02870 [Aerococcus sp. HMSC035B07]MDK6233914.1 hypothetical protein [Aerococcus sp. UMB10185]MDK6856369.1 hypothetical protein [Aerococcus sp. UMB7533]MDK8502660.1 hypothetical protein [Aerococcus sp. UMB1112A]
MKKGIRPVILGVLALALIFYACQTIQLLPVQPSPSRSSYIKIERGPAGQWGPRFQIQVYLSSLSNSFELVP